MTTTWQRLVVWDPSPRDVRVVIPQAALCALGRYDDALRDADAAIALDPTWAKTYSRKGKALYAQQSYRRAADAYARGLEICLKGAVGEAQQRDAELECVDLGAVA